MNKIYLVIIFLCSLLLPIYGQQIAFINYGTNEGLPQSQVSSIQQDKDGYIWIGTIGGLAKFNGEKFYTYTSEDGLVNNKIAMISRIDDEIWVGHKGYHAGVSLIHSKQIKKWIFEDRDENYDVTNILKFKNQVFVSTYNSGLYAIQGKLLKKKSNWPETVIYNMLIYENRLFIASSQGIFYTSDGKQFKKLQIGFSANVLDFSILDKQIIFIASEKGCYSYSFENRKTKKLNLISSEIYVDQLYIDQAKRIWLYSVDGAFCSTTFNGFTQFNTQTGFPTSGVTALFQDNSGNVWVGTEGKGILNFPSEDIKYFNKRDGLPSDIITSINQKKNGDYYFTTFDQGIFIQQKNKAIKSIFQSNTCVWQSLLDVNGKDWFASNIGLLYKDGQTIKNYPDSNLLQSKITSFYKLDNQSFYVGGNNGVYLIKGKQCKQIVAPYFKGNYIGTVRDLTLFKGELFFATEKGIYVVRDRELKINKKITKSVYTLANVDNKTLWIGTEEGLYKLEDKQLNRVHLAPDVSANFIVFIRYYNGQLIVGTNNGLYIKTNSSSYFKHLGRGEGIVDLECNINSVFQDRKQLIWYGTPSGVVQFNLGSLIHKYDRPILKINQILINHQQADLQKYFGFYNQAGYPNSISVPYTKNNLTFELDAIQLMHHKDIKYQYKIEGLEDKWSPLFTHPEVTFTGLPTGEYTVLFRAKLNEISSNIIQFKLHIKAPFYKTYWFYSLVIVLILIVIYFISRYQIKQAQQKSERENLEVKSKLSQLEQKSLNASMNRHFIFNALNSIQYFINSQDRISANRYLTNFAKLIRKNLDSSVEEGNMVLLQDELEGLELYLSLEAMRFQGKFTYSIQLDEIDEESIKIPAMLLQPFVENSIIHGVLPLEDRKGHIQIDLTMEEDLLVISIKDNGIGIENSKVQKAGMMGDHKSQGMEITSKRIELLKRLSMSRYELIGPFQINENDTSLNGTQVLIKIQQKTFDN